MTHERALFGAYEMTAFYLPRWFDQFGFRRYKPLVTMMRQSWEHWGQCELDGLGHLSPIVACFNRSPSEIKKQIGGHKWHAVRTAGIRTNANRMALRLIGGYSFDECMHWPIYEQKHAKNLVKRYGKSELLVAMKLSEKRGDLMTNLIVARDIVRMGGVVDANWGKGRLKREHDALVLKRSVEATDPTPWAKPWQTDVGPYTIKLLTSERELAIEGGQQKHCVRSYADACRKGREIVFSVIGPERATVSHNSAYLQVKLFANKRASAATTDAARQAVNQYRETMKVKP